MISFICAIEAPIIVLTLWLPLTEDMDTRVQ